MRIPQLVASCTVTYKAWRTWHQANVAQIQRTHLLDASLATAISRTERLLVIGAFRGWVTVGKGRVRLGSAVSRRRLQRAKSLCLKAVNTWRQRCSVSRFKRSLIVVVQLRRSKTDKARMHRALNTFQRHHSNAIWHLRARHIITRRGGTSARRKRFHAWYELTVRERYHRRIVLQFQCGARRVLCSQAMVLWKRRRRRTVHEQDTDYQLRLFDKMVRFKGRATLVYTPLTCSAVLICWHKWVTKQRKLCVAVAKATFIWRTEMALRKWRDHLRHLKAAQIQENECRHELVQSIFAERVQALSNAVHRWQVGMSEIRLESLKRIRAAKFLEHNERQSQTLSLWGWQKVVRDKRQLFLNISMAFRRVISRRLQLAMVRWCVFAREEAQLRMTACRLASEVRCEWFRTMMAMWRLRCRIKLHFRASAFLLLKQHSNGLKNNSFSRWHRSAQNQQKHTAYKSMALYLLQEALKRMRHTILSAALLSWSEAAYESKTLTVKRGRLVGRCSRQTATACLCAWYEETMKEKGLKAISRKLTRKILYSRVKDAFRRWARIQCMRTMLTRITRRWTLHIIACVLEAWLTRSLLQSQRRQEMTQLHYHRTQRVASASFDVWRTNAWELTETKTKATKLVAQVLFVKLAMGFSMWHRNATNRVRARKAVQRVVSRMQTAARALGFCRWYDNVQEQSIIERVVVRMKNAGMCVAFARWREGAVEKNVLAAKTLKLIGRWKNQHVVKAVDAWREYRSEGARKRNLMSRILQRMQHRGAVWALTLWHSNVLDVVRERAEEEQRNIILRRVVSRMQTAARALGFCRWYDNVQELRRQQSIIERVVVRMKNAGMCAAFARWREGAVEKKVLAAKSTSVMLRWRSQGVVRCIEAWKELTMEEARKRNTIRRFVSRVQQRRAAVAMELWYDSVLITLQERADEMWRTAIMRRVATRVQTYVTYGKIVNSFSTWKWHAADNVRLRAMAGKAVKKLTVMAFSSWLASVEEGKNLKMRMHLSKHISNKFVSKILKILASRISSRLIRKAWAMWKEHCLDTRQWKIKYQGLARLLMRFKRAKLRKTFVTWLGHVQELARLFHWQIALLDRAQKSCLSRAWNTWALYYEDTAEMSLEIALIGPFMLTHAQIHTNTPTSAGLFSFTLGF